MTAESICTCLYRTSAKGDLYNEIYMTIDSHRPWYNVLSALNHRLNTAFPYQRIADIKIL